MAIPHNPSESHIVVGMSGGVDSSVSALRLLEQGYQVSGLFMKNWEEDDTEEYCSAATDMADAESVCHTLGIPFHTVNFAHEYWENVFEHFLAEYKAGRTPNPDILCNKEIKFKEFLLQAEHLGANFIATGHYVANGQDDSKQQVLLRGKDTNKDQSYFLYTLGQQQLNKSIFPLGELEKSKVREIANKAGFVTHNKKDSTGICFIGERRFKDFLSTYLKPNPGEMITLDKKIMGQHDGLMYHTIGQRHGLNIGGEGDAWYVAAKDIENNQLLVVQGHDHPALMSSTVIAYDCHWVNGQALNQGEEITAKTRYRQEDKPCLVESVNEQQITIRFLQPQRAVTPGQALVFYTGRVCLGGATIVSTH